MKPSFFITKDKFTKLNAMLKRRICRYNSKILICTYLVVDVSSWSVNDVMNYGIGKQAGNGFDISIFDKSRVKCHPDRRKTWSAEIL